FASLAVIARCGCAPPEVYTPSLHAALPICAHGDLKALAWRAEAARGRDAAIVEADCRQRMRRDHVDALRDGKAGISGENDKGREDRKSTRLNSSHVKISYAVFCLKKKKTYV